MLEPVGHQKIHLGGTHGAKAEQRQRGADHDPQRGARAVAGRRHGETDEHRSRWMLGELMWAAEADKVNDFHLLRYEDLRANTREELRKLLDFMQVDATDADVEAAVEYSSYENMKKMESKQQFRFAGGRMMPRDKDNPDSYKVRRAKVGGYRDYFSDGEVAVPGVGRVQGGRAVQGEGAGLPGVLSSAKIVDGMIGPA